MRRLLATLACLALLVTLLPTPALAAAPPNDNWADAALITGTSGSVTGTNAEATLETNEDLYFGFANSVWYRWSPGRKDLVATFTTCDGAGWDTILQVSLGSVGPPDWTDFVWVTGNDDACGLQSRVQFVARGGETYWIRLGGFSDVSFGAFTLSWTTTPAIRGSLSVTLTNTQGDPSTCTVVVKGNDLLIDQWVRVVTESGYYSGYVYIQSGRFTSDPQYLARSDWNVQAAGSLRLDAYVLSADGISVVTPKFTNRCKP